MKGPDQLAGPDIPRADIHRRTLGVVLLALRTGDDQVPVDQPGRRHQVRHRRELVGDADAQVDRPVIAERRNQLARRGVEREQASVRRSRQNSRRQAAVAGPVRHAAVRGSALLEFVLPDLCACRRIERDDRPSRGRRVEHAAHENRDGLAPANRSRARDAVLPRQLQPRDVLRVDLRERRISPPLSIAAVRFPTRWRRVLGVEKTRAGHARQENRLQFPHRDLLLMVSTHGHPRRDKECLHRPGL